MITVRIATVDRSDKVKTEVTRRTVKMSLGLGSEWKATIPVFDLDAIAGYRPDMDDAVVIEHDGTSPATTLFNGDAVGIQEGPLDVEANEGVLSVITAKAALDLLEKIEDVTETFAAGLTRKQAIQQLHTAYLTGTGITLDPAMSNGATLPEIVVDGVTPAVVLNQIQDITGDVWRLTPDDVLEMFAPGDKTAVISLDDTNAGSVTVDKSRSKFCNRVRLKIGTASLVVKDDVFTGDGLTDSWESTYTPATNTETGVPLWRGVIHVDDGVSPVDETLSEPGGGGSWEFNAATNVLTRMAGNLPSGVVATFTYTVQFPVTVVVEDAASIAAVGLWSKTFTRTNIFDMAAGIDAAQGLLATGLTHPRIVTLMTTAGFELPGTTITLTFPKRLITGSWLITNVDVADFEGDDVEYTYTCQSGTRQQRTSRDTVRDRLEQSSGSSAVAVPTVAAGDVTGSGTAGGIAAWSGVKTLTTRNSGALSVVGRSVNSAGNPVDISATATSDAVLRESGSTVGFGQVATGGLADDAVTNAKIRNSGALSVIGRSANSAGDPADISAVAASDAVLRESGGVVGFGQVATAGLADGAVTNIKVATGIDAAKLGDGSVSNTEYQYLDGLRGNIQDQIDQRMGDLIARRFWGMTCALEASPTHRAIGWGCMGTSDASGTFNPILGGSNGDVSDAAGQWSQFLTAADDTQIGLVAGMKSTTYSGQLFKSIIDPVFYCRFRTGPNITDTRWWIGLATGIPAVGTDNPGTIDYAMFRHSGGTDSGWVGAVRDLTTQQVSSTVASIAVSTEYIAKIRVASNGTAIFFSIWNGSSWSSEVQMSTNLPRTTVMLGLVCTMHRKTGGSGDKTFDYSAMMAVPDPVIYE